MPLYQQHSFKHFLSTAIFKRIALSLLLIAVTLHSLVYVGRLLVSEKNIQFIDHSLFQTAELLQASNLTDQPMETAPLLKISNTPLKQSSTDYLLFRTKSTDMTGFYFYDITESIKKEKSKWRLLTFKHSDGNFYTIGYPAHRFLDEPNLLFMLAIVAINSFLLILGGLSILTAFRHFRQLSIIQSTVLGFSRGDVTRRVPAFNAGSDLNKIGSSLNSILNRSEHLITNSRQIINNISHDLRKPLTRIKNRLELLQFETTDNYQVDELDKSIQDADNLLKTFNDLLSISQAETGMHRDVFERVSLRAICEDMIEMYEPIAEERGVIIKLMVDNPFTIIGNKQLLTQLISNLIDNACKYAAGDDGQLIIFAESTLHHTTLRFADNGPGIPLELREKVLERFVRLDAARTAEGNGLGLSLAKAVMELHQGELVLGRTSKNDSRPGLLVKLVFPKVDQENSSKKLRLTTPD